MTDPPDPAPDPASRAVPSRLDRRERRTVALAAILPIGGAMLVLAPIAWVTGAGVGEVVAAAFVYGGLLGLAAAFVTVDRLQARRCPRCGHRQERRSSTCVDCGYDLVARPRFVCDEGHEVQLSAGLCRCGRRLRELPAARGVGREVVVILKVGGWLLALLIGIGIALQLLERAT